jgi:hypothetical protein
VGREAMAGDGGTSLSSRREIQSEPANERRPKAAEDCRTPQAGAPSNASDHREASWTAAVPCRFLTETHVLRPPASPYKAPKNSHADCSNFKKALTTGEVSVVGQTVRFTRPGLIEEYSVTMDGLRQDFVVLERPQGIGRLCVQLSLARLLPWLAREGLIVEPRGPF